MEFPFPSVMHIRQTGTAYQDRIAQGQTFIFPTPRSPTKMTPRAAVSRSFQRSRLLYAVLVVLVVMTGLFWRSRFLPLPATAAKYGGDALWAVVVFAGLGILFRSASTMRLALIALCFAWTVEFSQLYHAPWIDTVRATLPGRLVLGSTFNWPDLLAYAAGIAMAAFLEHYFLSRRMIRL